MRIATDDDSTGKQKLSAVKSRSAALTGERAACAVERIQQRDCCKRRLRCRLLSLPAAAPAGRRRPPVPTWCPPPPLLAAALLVGVCLGVMVSEKLYLASQEAALEPGAVEAIRSRKMELGGGGGGGAVAAVNTRRNTGKPRNALEEILQRVAPQGEVMIAISNHNLVLESSLVMWLEVRRKGGWYHPALGRRKGGTVFIRVSQSVLPRLVVACVLLHRCIWPLPATRTCRCYTHARHPLPLSVAAGAPLAVRATHPHPDQLAGGGH